MSRVLISLTMLLASTSAASAASTSAAASGSPGIIIHGPTFRYALEGDRNPMVCQQMLRVFNEKFTRLWDSPPMPWSKSDQDYSATSKYAFPLLPGLKHSTQFTYDMRFSAQPSSREFSAIPWKEGTAVAGGCPAGKVCAGEQPQPVLAAYFDFDNDGRMDTVIKGGSFFSGYLGMYHANEILTVWRGQRLKITDTINSWDLEHPKDKALTPIIMWGTYLRPFIYRGVSYVARYVPSFASNSWPSLDGQIPPYPVREDILVEQYHYTGRKDRIGRPTWTSETVCDLRMKRLNNG